MMTRFFFFIITYVNDTDARENIIVFCLRKKKWQRAALCMKNIIRICKNRINKITNNCSIYGKKKKKKREEDNK